MEKEDIEDWGTVPIPEKEYLVIAAQRMTADFETAKCKDLFCAQKKASENSPLLQTT